MKYKLLNDYSEGAHPSVLDKLVQTNMQQQSGYGADAYTLDAVEKIKTLFACPQAAVHLVSGGTQANLLVIAAMLKPYESVIAADSGHINTHEAGAIEATGHKIEYLRSDEGKIEVNGIARMLQKFPKYHTVKPRLVYISLSTEVGTLYSKAELEEIYTYCQNNNLILFIDGARLAMALTAKENDIAPEELATLCDIFYLGGTKCGALLGEAIVIINPDLQEDFAYHIKQRGAMLAKGRVLGIQFSALLENKLMFQLAEHANAMAYLLSQAFYDLGYRFWARPQTNQIFPIVPYTVMKKLLEKYDFFEWEVLDEEHSAIRLVTSWATPETLVQQFIRDLQTLSK